VHPTRLGTQIAQHAFAVRHSAMQFLKISSGTRRIFEGHDITAINGTIHVSLHLVSKFLAAPKSRVMDLRSIERDHVGKENFDMRC
jgi:hypothetical protein